MTTSFEAWVVSSQPRLLAFAYLLCADREEARDVVQDVYGRLAQRYQKLADEGGIDAYARRSVTNEVASRRRKHRPVTVPLVSEPAVAAAADRVPDRVLAWRLCQELPATQRAAVVLRYFDDASYAEIGEILRMPEATARSHVHRALAALRERMTEEDSR